MALLKQFFNVPEWTPKKKSVTLKKLLKKFYTIYSYYLSTFFKNKVRLSVITNLKIKLLMTNLFKIKVRYCNF